MAEGISTSPQLVGYETDPIYAEAVREAVWHNGLQACVTMLGQVTPAELRPEFGEAAAFVSPSCQENAPMVISEAMAAGVSVVAPNLCGMPHMVQEGWTGFLVDPEDTDMLAHRITRLLREDCLRVERGRTARQVALERFHPDSVARRTRDVYELLASEHRRGLPA